MTPTQSTGFLERSAQRNFLQTNKRPFNAASRRSFRMRLPTLEQVERGLLAPKPTAAIAFWIQDQGSVVLQALLRLEAEGKARWYVSPTRWGWVRL
jgi:hypothetical protein